MLNSKFIGGVLLIIGTSIGGGMLALPVSTAEVGFTNSLFFLFLCWLIMTCGALLVLEVNLRLPMGSNLVSMAKVSLGLPGQIIAWVAYLFLLYTLLAAYISGGGDVLQSLLARIDLDAPAWSTALLFTLLFSAIVYRGIKAVDYVNRGLMFGKLGVYLILLIIISPHAEFHTLEGGSLQAITGCLMILIASFSFASIVPSLRDYFENDITVLRRVILLGSFIPLLCYIAWDAVIMASITREGTGGLLALKDAAHATSGLTNALSQAVQSQWITAFFSFFTSICMITAFLGVSIGLFDFLADGLRLQKSGKQGKRVLTFTFLPPLIIVLINPGIYLHALSYAGICCVILLLFLPIIMTWKTRAIVEDAAYTYLVPGGKPVLTILFLLASILLGCAI